MTLPHHASGDFRLRTCSLPRFTFATMMGVALVAPAVLAAAAERAFDVPAGEAAGTLKQFAVQSGQQVVFMGDTVRGEKTQAVKGVYTPQQALALMLAGTRLLVMRDPATGALAVKKVAPDPNAPRAVPTARKARAARPVQEPTGRAIELNPFVVTSEGNDGYQATSTLAGSRMNTSLRNTASSLSVLTAELMADLGAVNLDDAVAFANNVELDDTNASNDNGRNEFFNTFRIRGQAAAVARNYFKWRLPTNTFNIERIEEARGPNSILFGIASAGGLISAQTKQASTYRDFVKVQLVYGSYDERRAGVDINQASDNAKLGVRLNAVVSDAQAYQHFVFNQDDRVHLAVKYNLTPNTVIRAEYEKGRTRAVRANTQEIGDNLLRWYNAGRPLVGLTGTATGVARNGTGAGIPMVTVIAESPDTIVLADYRGQGITQAAGSALISDPTIVDPANFRVNIGGAGQTQNSDFDTCSVFVEQKLFKRTYLQLAFNHQESEFHSWQSRNNTGLKGDPNQFLRDGTPNPHAGRMYFEDWWANYNRWDKVDNLRFSVSQEINLGPWGEYRLAGLYEREESNFVAATFAEHWIDSTTGRGAFNNNGSPAVIANRTFRRHYITLGDHGTYFASYNNPSVTGVLSNVTDPSNAARKLETRVTQINGWNDLQEQDSFLFSGQAFYFQRKLVVAGGLRADTLYLHESVRNQISPVDGTMIVDPGVPRINRTAGARTKILGMVCHVTPWFSLRANRSDSRELANIAIRLLPRRDASGVYSGGSRVGDNPHGKGADYGVEFNFLDGKINLRAARFETTRAGAQGFGYGSTDSNPAVMNNRIIGALADNGLISESERVLRTLNSGGTVSDTKSTGYEFGLTANPTKNWRLAVNCSITDSVSDNIAPEIQAWAADMIPWFQTFNQSIVLNTGQTIAEEIARWQEVNENEQSVNGVATIGNRRDKINVLTRYTFTDGALQGLYLGGTAVHQGKMVIAATVDNEVLYGNSFTTAGVFIGYRFGRVPGVKFLKNLNVQLNVFNVLNQTDPLIRRIANANAAVIEVSRLSPQPPRCWRLTADLAF